MTKGEGSPWMEEVPFRKWDGLVIGGRSTYFLRAKKS